MVKMNSSSNSIDQGSLPSNWLGASLRWAMGPWAIPLTNAPITCAETLLPLPPRRHTHTPLHWACRQCPPPKLLHCTMGGSVPPYHAYRWTPPELPCHTVLQAPPEPWALLICSLEKEAKAEQGRGSLETLASEAAGTIRGAASG